MKTRATYSKVGCCESITGWYSSAGRGVCIEGVYVGKKGTHDSGHPRTHVLSGQAGKMPVNNDAALYTIHCHREKIQHVQRHEIQTAQILYKMNPFERQTYLTKLIYKQIYIFT